MSKARIETIIDLIKCRDAHGFELLYENHARLLYGVAFSITGNEELSKEAVQRVVVRLYTMDEKLFPASNELTWLYTVTKNETLMLLREEKRMVSMDELPEMPVEAAELSELVDRDSFDALIASLDEKRREVVTLRTVAGMSHKEIAQATGRPIGTVQWLYNTSIKKLRTALTALAVIALGSGAGLAMSLKAPESAVSAARMMPGPEPSVSSLPIVLGIICVLAAAALVGLFVNSDKLPEKKRKDM